MYMYVCGKRFKVHAESMFDIHVTVKVWNQYCFCIFHSTKQYFMVKWRKAHHRLGTSSNMWAAAWQNQQNEEQSEDTDQPWHLPSLISLRYPHEEPCTFSYPLSALSSLGAQVILFFLFVFFCRATAHYKANIKIILISLYQTIYNCI